MKHEMIIKSCVGYYYNKQLVGGIQQLSRPQNHLNKIQMWELYKKLLLN